MKKALSVFAILLLIVGFSNAQSKIKLSAGVNLALPSGDFGDIAGTGFGGTVMGEYPLAEKIVGTATIGYLTWGTKEFSGGEWSYSAIPILAGAKYYFQNNFYGYGQLGFHMFSFSYEADMGPWFGKVKSDDSSTEFTIGLGAGYEIDNFDLSAGYYIISDANYIGVRAAYKFSL